MIINLSPRETSFLWFLVGAAFIFLAFLIGVYLKVVWLRFVCGANNVTFFDELKYSLFRMFRRN